MSDQYSELLDLINNPDISKEQAKQEQNGKVLDVVDKLIALENDFVESKELKPITLPPIEELRAAKLTVVEKAAMEEFVARKCPGIDTYDSRRMLALYLTGHDTADLIKVFPDSEVGGIAYLKARDNWDQQRKEFLESIQYRSKVMLATTRHKSIFAVTGLVNTFLGSLESALRNYHATGDISMIPKEFIPSDLKGFKELMGLLKMFSDIKLTDTPATPQNSQPQTAVQLNIHNNNQEAKKEPTEANAFEFLERVLQGSKGK